MIKAQEICGSDLEGAGDVDQIETASAGGGRMFLRECESSGEHCGMVNLHDLETTYGDILGEVLPEQRGLFGALQLAVQTWGGDLALRPDGTCAATLSVSVTGTG